MNYMGSALATLICYAVIAVLSWYFGQRYYPIPYNLKRVLGYLFGAVAVYLLVDWLALEGAAMWLVHLGLLAGFTLTVLRLEKTNFSA